MEEEINITENELIQALMEAERQSDGGGGMTTRELIQVTGRSRLWIYERLRRLKSTGRIVSEQARRVSLDDRVRWAAVYRIKHEVNKNEPKIIMDDDDIYNGLADAAADVCDIGIGADDGGTDPGGGDGDAARPGAGATCASTGGTNAGGPATK